MNLEDIYYLGAIITGLKMMSYILEEIKDKFLFRVYSIFTPMTDKNIDSLLKMTNELAEVLKDILEILTELDISEETQQEIIIYISKCNNLTFGESYNYVQAENEIIALLKEIETDSIKWEDRIQIELRKIPFIMPYLDGSLDSTKLLRGAKCFITNEDVWNNMQIIEKEDLDDFLRSFLNKAWTPAGIMAMRVVESSVRYYYKKLTGKDNTNWGKILDDLKKNHPSANKDLIKRLDYIRGHVRKPLAHPEQRLNSLEAEECFQQALFVVNRVYS